jgi:hypothetical protein
MQASLLQDVLGRGSAVLRQSLPTRIASFELENWDGAKLNKGLFEGHTLRLSTEPLNDCDLGETRAELISVFISASHRTRSLEGFPRCFRRPEKKPQIENESRAAAKEGVISRHPDILRWGNELAGAHSFFCEGRLQPCHPFLDAGEGAGERFVIFSPAKYRIVYPPIHAHFLRFVDRADDQAELDRQELDIDHFHSDIACDDDSFVQDTLQYI